MLISSSSNNDDFKIALVLFLAFSALFSIPALIIYHIAAIRLYKNTRPINAKFILSGIMALLTFISCYIGFNIIELIYTKFDEMQLYTSLMYWAACTIFIFIFNYQDQPAIQTYSETEMQGTRAKNDLAIITGAVFINLFLSVMHFSNMLMLIVRHSLGNVNIVHVIVSYILPVAGISIGLYLMWRLKKAGWILLTFFSGAGIISFITYIITGIVNKYPIFRLELLLPFLLSFLLWGIVSVIIHKKRVLISYNITPNNKVFAYILAVLYFAATYFINYLSKS
jgi:hypothetical protein